MPDDSTPSPEEQQPERRFRVNLVQLVPEHWKVTEQFESVGDEPLSGDKKQALRQVQNFIDDEKDLEGVEYKLEAEEIELPEQPPVNLLPTDDQAEEPPQA